MFIKKCRGFTMVEMVVTMLIIITLSLLSFPLYRGRSQESSKLSEGYALLGYIVNAQIAYFNEYGNFLSSLESSSQKASAYTYNEDVLGINAINNRYFTCFSINNISQGTGTSPMLRAKAKYCFVAEVRSANAGTISIQYNKTQRFEPVVSGI